MSEFRRRLLIQSGSDPNALPAGCVRCEYLESNGGSWIDTERKVRQGDDIYVRFELFSTNGIIYGWRNGADAQTSAQCYIDFYGLAYGIPARDRVPTPISLGIGSFLISPSKGVVIVKDTTLANLYYDTSFSLAYRYGESIHSPYLFTLSYGQEQVTSSVKCRIYEYYTSNTLGYTQRILPILDQEGVPCMYDTINKKFHYNKGTGQFLYKILEQ